MLLNRIHVEPQQSLKSWNMEFDTARRQIVESAIMALWFCKSEHPAAQHYFSWCRHSPNNQPPHSASLGTVTTVDKSKKQAVEMTTIYKRRQELTPTNVADDMAKCIQITRVMSANTTHLTKILVVNRKQLSSNIIDPLFLWYLWLGWQCQGRATVGKVSKSMH
jgi:hypothetical protein